MSDSVISRSKSVPSTPSIESRFPEGPNWRIHEEVPITDFPLPGTLPGLPLPGLSLPKDASLLKIFKLEKDDDTEKDFQLAHSTGESSQTSQV